MAVTTKEEGVWILPDVYAKQQQGSIWEYTGIQGGYSLGINQEGAAGVNVGGPAVRYSSPTQLAGAAANWHEIHGNGGMFGSVAMHGIKTDGSLWGWGNMGSYGAGGFNKPSGGPSNVSSPVMINGGAGGLSSLDSSGGGANVFRDSSGKLFSWGLNTEGQLGHNDKVDRSSPIQIGTDTTWSANIACAGYQMMGVKTDGTLWTWGANHPGDYTGALGQNNKTQYSSPRQVGTDTNWTFIDGGNGYITRTTFGIKDDNTLWAWGNGATNGTLGLNENSNYSSPVQVPGSWKYASAGHPNAGLVSFL